MASQEELDREQELLRLTQQRAGIQEDILEDVRDIGNTISTQLQNLKFERAERTEIRSLTREINKTATENYNISLKELGSQKQLLN
jgi:hypoxanthine-guanine phosphoribosyltransferase